MSASLFDDVAGDELEDLGADASDILEFHLEPAGGPEALNGGRPHGEDHRILDLPELRVEAVDHGLDLILGVGSVVPVFENNPDRPRVGRNHRVENVVATDVDGASDGVLTLDDFGDLIEHLGRSTQRGGVGQLRRDHEPTLVL